MNFLANPIHKDVPETKGKTKSPQRGDIKKTQMEILELNNNTKSKMKTKWTEMREETQ